MANVPQWHAASHASNHAFSPADDQGAQLVTLMYKDTEEYFKSFPPGYRFCPTDHELIVHYLNKKIKKEVLPLNKIHEVNLYRHSPEHLSEIYPAVAGKEGGKEWYFFTPRDRKYANGTRPNRAAGSGYWKATGADKVIKDRRRSTVGYRKALVFYEGRPPKGEKKDWIMHEYRSDAQPSKKRCASDMKLDDYVLCRIYRKEKPSKRQKDLLPIQPNVQLQNMEENHNEAQSDSHGVQDDINNHVEEVCRDYGNEVQGIPQYGGDNRFPSFDYESEQTSFPNLIGNNWPDINSMNYQYQQTCFVNPIESTWNMSQPQPQMQTHFQMQMQPQQLQSMPIPTSTTQTSVSMSVPTSTQTSTLPMTNYSFMQYSGWQDIFNQTNFDDIDIDLDALLVANSPISFACPPSPPKS